MSETKYRVKTDSFGRLIIEPFKEGHVLGIIIAIFLLLVVGWIWLFIWLIKKLVNTKVGRIILIASACIYVALLVAFGIYAYFA